MGLRIKKDDRVVVISGAHRGATGKVLRVDREKDRVYVEGVNMVYRHLRRSQQNPQGGRVQKEGPIHLSNVQPLDPTTGKGTRVRFPVVRGADGKVKSKQRVAVASGTVLNDITRAESKRSSEAG
jgi:large subunit ribosomal protein L24